MICRVHWYDSSTTSWLCTGELDEPTIDLSEMKKLISRGVVVRDNVVFLGVPYESGVGGWLLHFSLPSLTHPDLLQPRAAILSQLRQSLRNNIILLYHAMHYKCGSKRSTEASSISAEKLDVTTRVLQELFAPGMKLDAMLKSS